MVEVRKTAQYRQWFESLRDRQARARIGVRLLRLQDGNPGQHRVLSDGVVEMKIDYGPGYRVYYTFKGKTLILLLCGGDKSTQSKDIRLATEIAASWET